MIRGRTLLMMMVIRGRTSLTMMVIGVSRLGVEQLLLLLLRVFCCHSPKMRQQ